MDRIEEIEECLAGFNCRTIDNYSYALYSTIQIHELCELYFSHAKNADVKNKIIRHIYSKIKHKKEEIPKSFFTRLLKEFEQSVGRIRITHGTTLKEFRSFMSGKQLKEFFDSQILSEKISDRKRAVVVANQVYDKDIEAKLWEAWGKYHDSGAIDILMNKTDINTLSPVFKELWDDDKIYFKSKISALKRIAKIDISTLSFLKDRNSVSYLTACVAAKNDVSDDFCMRAIRSLDNINSLGYLLWCVGMLGKYELLKSIKHELQDIEKPLKREFWEYFEEDYA